MHDAFEFWAMSYLLSRYETMRNGVARTGCLVSYAGDGVVDPSVPDGVASMARSQHADDLHSCLSMPQMKHSTIGRASIRHEKPHAHTNGSRHIRRAKECDCKPSF